LIEEQLEFAKPGFRSRGNKILKMLRTQQNPRD